MKGVRLIVAVLFSFVLIACGSGTPGDPAKASKVGVQVNEDNTVSLLWDTPPTFVSNIVYCSTTESIDPKVESTKKYIGTAESPVNSPFPLNAQPASVLYCYVTGIDANTQQEAPASDKIKIQFPPAAPKNTVAYDGVNGELNISWNAVAGANGYNVYVDGKLAKATDNLSANAGDVVSVALPDVSASSSHTVIVTAFINDGDKIIESKKVELKDIIIGLAVIGSKPSNDALLDGNTLDSISINTNRALDTSAPLHLLLSDGEKTETLDFPKFDGNTVTFNLVNKTLKENTKYTVTLPKGIKDASGHSLASDHTFFFRTSDNKTGFRVTVTKPSNNEKDVKIADTKTIQVNFFGELAPASVDEKTAITLTRDDGKVIIPGKSKSGGTNTTGIITFTLDDGVTLQRNVVYTAKISASVADNTGKTLGSDKIITFTTELPTLEVTAAKTTVDENEGTITFDVKLKEGVSGNPTTVHYVTAPDTAKTDEDFTAADAILTIPAGEPAATVTIPIKNDSIYETKEEKFRVSFDNAVGANFTNVQSDIAITDNDAAPTINVSVKTPVQEKDGKAAVTVTLEGNASALPVSVNYSTIAGTATKVDDFTDMSGTINFPALEKSVPLNIPIANDGVPENDETFTFKLSDSTVPAITIANAQTTITIENTDAPKTAPQNVVATVNGGQVKLTWNAVDGATGYNVYVSETSATYGKDPTVRNVSSGSVIPNLYASRTYYFVVKAFAGSATRNGSPESDASTEVSAKIPFPMSIIEMLMDD